MLIAVNGSACKECNAFYRTSFQWIIGKCGDLNVMVTACNRQYEWYNEIIYSNIVFTLAIALRISRDSPANRNSISMQKVSHTQWYEVSLSKCVNEAFQR